MAVAAQARASTRPRRAPAPEPPRFAPPALREAAARRLAELGGLAMALGAIAVGLALLSYNPRDPSLNTATSQHATNLLGPAGSIVAA